MGILYLISFTFKLIDGCCTIVADWIAPCQTLIFGAAMIMTGTRTPGI